MPSRQFLRPNLCYTWDGDSCADVVLVAVTDCQAFVLLLTSHTTENYSFLSSEQVSGRRAPENAHTITNGLLGGISEFACYVLRVVHEGHRPPLIHCFRAAHPLAPANYPYVDVGVFVVGTTEADDLLHLQEIKATRDNPAYFRSTEEDYSGLYSKSRLNSTVEHMKFDLKQSSQTTLIPRINDCVGTSPGDSYKILLNPTGVSANAVPVETCKNALCGITGRLRDAGWPIVRAMHLHVPDIEGVYAAFATGQGVR
jgi:hypothetical protein